MPSLEYYVVVEQDFCQVAVLSRAGGIISQYYYLGDEIQFPLLDMTVSVTDIYEGIEHSDQEIYHQKLLADQNR